MKGASDRDRVVPTCRHADVCGGCDWQHIGYTEQLRRKREIVEVALATTLGPAVPAVEPAIGMPAGEPGSSGPTGVLGGHDVGAPWGFRHKVHFVFAPGPRGRTLAMGHYRRGSRRVVPVEECPVHAAAGNRVAFAVRDALAASGLEAVSADLGRGVVRHLVVRVARRDGETIATLVVKSNDAALRGAVRHLLSKESAPNGLHLNIHDRRGPHLFGRETRRLHGRARLRDEVAGVSFLISPTAFFQTNIQAADILVGLVRDALPERPSRILDLYAGAGLFALPLARMGHHVTAVEENEEAVADGRASQKFSQVSAANCRFIHSRVEDVSNLASTRRGAHRPDCVIVDPPRAGCGPIVLREVCECLSPGRMIYVSCDPEALAGDLAVIVKAGYRLDRVQPVDMFPHTTHVETVVALTRGH